MRIAVFILLVVASSGSLAQEPAPTERPISNNPWQVISPFFKPPPEFQNQFGPYPSLLKSDNGKTISTAEQWALRRTHLRQEWHQMLGDWPAVLSDPEPEILDSERRGSLTQHRIRFRWTPMESTSGYLLVPDGPGPFPAVLTVFYEPNTAIGAPGSKPFRDYGLQLARRGFVTLSIGTTEATQAKTYALYYPTLEDAQVQPLSMLAYAAQNAWQVLAARPEVDPDRIGIVGHSFGGKWAMFASCLSDRFACAVWSDPGIMFQNDRSSINYWEPWYLGYHPKPWRKRGLITADNPARGLYPKLIEQGRNLHELHALMAPRPFLVSGGSEDPVGRWQALNHSVAVNRILGYENRVAMTNRPEHSPDAESNEVVYAFFEHFLQP